MNRQQKKQRIIELIERRRDRQKDKALSELSDKSIEEMCFIIKDAEKNNEEVNWDILSQEAQDEWSELCEKHGIAN